MEFKEIIALIDRFDTSSVTVLELAQGEWRLCLEKASAASGSVAPKVLSAAVPVAEIAAEAMTIKAPLVGTFYAAPAQGEAPFVRPGDRVKKGQTVCVLEAMKMMSEVPAPMDCTIEAVLVKDGELAGFDAPLFQVREG